MCILINKICTKNHFPTNQTSMLILLLIGKYIYVRSNVNKSYVGTYNT